MIMKKIMTMQEDSNKLMAFRSNEVRRQELITALTHLLTHVLLTRATDKQTDRHRALKVC